MECVWCGCYFIQFKIIKRTINTVIWRNDLWHTQPIPIHFHMSRSCSHHLAHFVNYTYAIETRRKSYGKVEINLKFDMACMLEYTTLIIIFIAYLFCLVSVVFGTICHFQWQLLIYRLCVWLSPFSFLLFFFWRLFLYCELRLVNNKKKREKKQTPWWWKNAHSTPKHLYQRIKRIRTQSKNRLSRNYVIVWNSLHYKFIRITWPLNINAFKACI